MKINEIERLYHGTSQKFDIFDFAKAKGFKDFGRGFYLTSNPVQAMRWAQKKAGKTTKAYMYSYTVAHVEPGEWKILELLKYDKKWLDFICKSRLEGFDTAYDIIYDKMADSYFSNISDALQAYLSKEVSAAEVIKELKWKEGFEADQYCFKNEKSLQLLKNKTIFEMTKKEDGIWYLDE